ALLALLDGDLLDELGDVGPVGVLGTPSGGTPNGLVPDPEGGSSQSGVDLDPHVDGATEPVERLPWAVTANAGARSRDGALGGDGRFVGAVGDLGGGCDSPIGFYIG